jgi:hypothetical protein
MPDSSMHSGLKGTDVGVGGGVNFASAAGNFVTSTKAGVGGLGAPGGRTGDETEIGETIALSRVGALEITSFSVGVLYNGAKFGGGAESARVQAFLGAALAATSVLQVDATNDTLAAFAGTGLGQAVADLGHLFQRGAACFEHRAQVELALARLRFQFGIGQQTAIRSDGDLPRHEEQLAGADARALGAAPRRSASRLEQPQRFHGRMAQRMASGAPIEPVAPTIGTGL